MLTILTLVLGAVGGFLAHSIAMRVSFKQRSIDHKINVYDKVIGHWVRMRNFVFSGIQPSDETYRVFDQMYGESQQFIGESILVCDDDELTTDINELNERLYRTEWSSLEREAVNERMETIKTDAIQIVTRMREDIKQSTRLELDDIIYIFRGLIRRSRRVE